MVIFIGGYSGWEAAECGSLNAPSPAIRRSSGGACSAPDLALGRRQVPRCRQRQQHQKELRPAEEIEQEGEDAVCFDGLTTLLHHRSLAAPTGNMLSGSTVTLQVPM